MRCWPVKRTILHYSVRLIIRIKMPLGRVIVSIEDTRMWLRSGNNSWLKETKSWLIKGQRKRTASSYEIGYFLSGFCHCIISWHYFLLCFWWTRVTTITIATEVFVTCNVKCKLTTLICHIQPIIKPIIEQFMQTNCKHCHYCFFHSSLLLSDM